MPVKYNVVERKNPLDKNSTPKFYAIAKADGEINLRAIAKEIAGGSTTVSDTDVFAVLNDLIKSIARHLNDGEIVKLGDFGTFRLTLSSEGVETAEKVNTSVIKSSKINFRPGQDLQDMLRNIKYEKYKK